MRNRETPTPSSRRRHARVDARRVVGASGRARGAKTETRLKSAATEDERWAALLASAEARWDAPADARNAVFDAANGASRTRRGRGIRHHRDVGDD